MKRFLQNITLFLFLLLIVAVVMEMVAESIPNSYTCKREYMEVHGNEIKTLILGSSNAYDGLNPSELPAAFNLANSSQTIGDDYLLLKKYIEGMDSLETVIIGLGYHSLGEGQEAHRKMYYTIYMDLYPRWPISKYSFEVFRPEILAKKIIKYMVSRDVTRCDSLGQRLGHTREAAHSGIEWWNKGVDALVENDKFKILDFRFQIDENICYLHKIVDLCNMHNVQPVIVQMPVMKEYKEALPKEQVAMQDSVLRTLKGKAVCVDASEWAIPEDGWYNATHLTREASVEFTKQVREIIENAQYPATNKYSPQNPQ